MTPKKKWLSTMATIKFTCARAWKIIKKVNFPPSHMKLQFSLKSLATFYSLSCFYYALMAISMYIYPFRTTRYGWMKIRGWKNWAFIAHTTIAETHLEGRRDLIQNRWGSHVFYSFFVHDTNETDNWDEGNGNGEIKHRKRFFLLFVFFDSVRRF